MLSSLDAFLLECIDQGLNTPYALKVNAGLSLGATLPALVRLSKTGLIDESKAKTGARARREFRINKQGTNALKTWIKQPVTGTSVIEIEDLCRQVVLTRKHLSEAESIRRIAALLSGLKPSSVSKPELPDRADFVAQYKYLLDLFKSGRNKADMETLASITKDKKANDLAGTSASGKRQTSPRLSAKELLIAHAIKSITNRLFASKAEINRALQFSAAINQKLNRKQTGFQRDVFLRTTAELETNWSRSYQQDSQGENEQVFYQFHFQDWLASVADKKTAMKAFEYAINAFSNPAE